MRGFALVVALLLSPGALGPSAGAQVEPRQRVRPALQKQIHGAIERGRAYFELQIAGGHGARVRTAAGTREGGLLLYAALHAGVERDSKSMSAALRDLARSKPAGTYLTACAILALARADSAAYREPIQRLADRLAGWQEKQGGWGYPSGEDLSNTQYAALGLWTAARAGAEVDPEVWVGLADVLPHFTEPYGGFSYRRSGDEPTTSMTAAGSACASIVRAMLGESAEGRAALTPQRERSLRLIEARALEWLGDHFVPGRNLGSRDNHTWPLYALYGIERAAALAGADRLGIHDWYAEGALFLVGSQNADGSWNGASGTVASTAFAVLFLGRATAKSTALVVSGPRSEVPGSEAAEQRRSDLGRNRMEVARPKVTSTTTADRHPVECAVDGDFETGWQSEAGDRVPTLSLDFESPHTIDTILVTLLPPRAAKPEAPARARPEHVLVVVNGARLHALKLAEVPGSKARLELPEPVELSRLELRMGAARSGDPSARAVPVGVAEVEIQLRPRSEARR